jgi:putative exosortase-associated protein (TIGR04073 family)
MFKKSVVLAIFAMVIFSASVYAADDNAATKFARGAANTLTGFVEVPKQIYLTSIEYDPLTGIVFGTVKGICYGALRTLAGVYDATFFVVPPYDKPVMEPEFVFEGWEREQLEQ